MREAHKKIHHGAKKTLWRHVNLRVGDVCLLNYEYKVKSGYRFAGYQRYILIKRVWCELFELT